MKWLGEANREAPRTTTDLSSTRRGTTGFLSRTDDLARWHHALLGDTILTPAARTKYYHPALRPTEAADSYYAFEWDGRRTPRNTLLLWHDVANGIFYVALARFMDDGAPIVVLMNQRHPDFRGVPAELFRVIFDSTYTPFIPVAVTQRTVPSPPRS